VEEGVTNIDPEVPTYVTVLRYTHELALDVDQLSVEPPPWLIGFGVSETEQEAGSGISRSHVIDVQTRLP